MFEKNENQKKDSETNGNDSEAKQKELKSKLTIEPKKFLFKSTIIHFKLFSPSCQTNGKLK